MATQQKTNSQTPTAVQQLPTHMTREVRDYPAGRKPGCTVSFTKYESVVNADGHAEAAQPLM